MRFLYDILFIVFAIGYVPVMLFRGRAKGSISQKAGFLPGNVVSLERPVWIHAVSVGEAAVAARLASRIKEKAPGTPVVVSTTTTTGNEMIHKAGKGRVDAVFYYPLDISFIVDKVIRNIDPRVYVMIETELWPNLLRGMKEHGVPVVLVNGRISDRSFSGYMKFRSFVKRILSDIDVFCMQSERDSERVVEMGALPGKVSVTGNIKFDDASDIALAGAVDKGELGMGPSDQLIIAGSTHFPEEQEIIGIFGDIRDKRPDARLVIAPRHPERSEAVMIYLEKAGFACARFSELDTGGPPAGGPFPVIVVDTIGHLRKLYSAADIVFIGGSIAERGGQNPLEAAVWGKPVVFGPYMHNFRQISELLVSSGGAVEVKDVPELARVLDELLSDPGRREEMSRNVRMVVERNTGAAERTAKKVLDEAARTLSR